MANSPEQLQRIFEAALMIAGRPLTVADLQKLFEETEQPDAKQVREILQAIQASYSDRGIELCEVASGFQFQAKADLSPWLSRLWEERAPRFTRAFLETIALIAYRQPITRAEIEEIRGVAVSSNIIKTLQEREWIRVIGYRDVPGKPALYGTTKTFLDHLNLKSLDQLPPLSELMDLDSQEEKLQVQLELSQQVDSETETDTEETVATSNDPDYAAAEMEEHEHSEDSLQDEDEHEHSDECIHDEDEHEHSDECMHNEDEHEHSDECVHDEDEHEHTEERSHNEKLHADDDENDITSDPYPEETAKA